MTGVVVGRLVFGTRAGSDKFGQAAWNAECSCGRKVVLTGAVVRRGGFVSCGCYRSENKANLKHGYSGSPEYRSWQHMLDRCRNPKDRKYPNYGGRGISVLFSSFEEFLAEVGPRPAGKYSIDRIDNDGNYEHGNVRWATPFEQARNRRPRRTRSELLAMASLALSLLFFAAPAFPQVERVDGTEDTEIASLRAEIATLKVDLLVQRLATLQAKANWLDRERLLMASEERDLLADRERVAGEIAESLGCESGYDLAARACNPGGSE